MFEFLHLLASVDNNHNNKIKSKFLIDTRDLESCLAIFEPELLQASKSDVIYCNFRSRLFLMVLITYTAARMIMMMHSPPEYVAGRSSRWTRSDIIDYYPPLLYYILHSLQLHRLTHIANVSLLNSSPVPVGVEFESPLFKSRYS